MPWHVRVFLSKNNLIVHAGIIYGGVLGAAVTDDAIKEILEAACAEASAG